MQIGLSNYFIFDLMIVSGSYYRITVLSNLSILLLFIFPLNLMMLTCSLNYIQSAQLMQKATKASRPLPSSVLRESFKKALEILEDSPTDSLFESMRVISGVATEEELLSDYKLFESSLRQLLGDQTANTILTFLHDESVNGFPQK
jgi:hypothetical protein